MAMPSAHPRMGCAKRASCASARSSYVPVATPSLDERLLWFGVLLRALQNRGELGAEIESGKWVARCPLASEHGSGSDYDTSTVVFSSTNAGDSLARIHCSHSNCGHDRNGVKDWLSGSSLRQFAVWRGTSCCDELRAETGPLEVTRGEDAELPSSRGGVISNGSGTGASGRPQR